MWKVYEIALNEEAKPLVGCARCEMIEICDVFPSERPCCGS